jgi:uncharacterized glyoxalase superfamily protein PhnB
MVRLKPDTTYRTLRAAYDRAVPRPLTIGEDREFHPQAISVRVDDPDALFARATAEGAGVVQAPETTQSGARGSWMRDPENFLWGFSTYRPAATDVGGLSL